MEIDRQRIIKVFKETEDPFYNFAIKVSKVMLDLSSSHVWFILQQAYGDKLDWGEAQEMLEHLQVLAKFKQNGENKNERQK